MIILFDLDGTLCDSEPGIQRSLAYALADTGYPVPDETVIRTLIGPPFAVGLPRIGVMEADVDQVIAAYRTRYHDVGAFENAVFPGVEQVLRTLSDEGHVLGVATSKPEASAFPILDHFGLSAFFKVRAGATLDSSRSAKSDVIRHAISELGALGHPVKPSNAWMIGDRYHDVDGARDHQLRCIGVTWGYGDETELVSAGATAIARVPEDILSILHSSAQH